MARLFTVLGKWLLVITMITAMGGHFMLLQSVAWTGMILSNIRHEAVGAALAQTFDGQHPCALCKCIEKARKSDDKQPPQVSATARLNLFCEYKPVTLYPPLAFRELGTSDTRSETLAHQPLLQPPRLRAVSAAVS